MLRLRALPAARLLAHGAPLTARSRRCPRSAEPAPRDAMLAWRNRHGRLPTSCDWSRSHASRRGGQALARIADGHWPASATVTDLYGSWAAAHAHALGAPRPRP